MEEKKRKKNKNEKKVKKSLPSHFLRKSSGAGGLKFLVIYF